MPVGGGKRGPKPLPSNVRDFASADTRSRANPDEPVFETDKLECPERFKGDMKQDFWDHAVPQLVKAGVATNIDQYALEALIQKWADYRVAQAKVDEHGFLIRTPSGYPQLSPYYSIATKALKDFQSLMVEFGMTPSSRTNIKVTEAMTGALEKEALDLSDLSKKERDQLKQMLAERRKQMRA